MTVRNMLLAVLFTTLAIPSFAQRGPRRPGGPRGFESRLESGEEDGQRRERDPSGHLEEALELNAAQVASLQVLLESNREGQEAIRAQVAEGRENLQSLIDQGASATDIGNALLGIHAIQDQAKASQEQFQTALRNLLTAEQQGKLDAIQIAGGRASGLMGGPGCGDRPSDPPPAG